MNDFFTSTGWINILQGLLTPTIAIVVAYVAWQQWKLGERRMKLDLYDRRKRIYEELKKLFDIVSRDATVDIRELADYWVNVSEADFLFQSDVTAYLRDVYDHGLRLWKSNRDYRDYTQKKPPGYDHDKVVESMDQELEWFSKQGEIALQKFKKYLNIHTSEV